MSKNKISYRAFSVHPHISRLRKNKSVNIGSTWIDGFVFTFDGAVGVYSEGDEKASGFTELQALKGSEIITKVINKRFSERGLITQAKRFAKELKNRS